jgi:type IV pilus assembly protein PilP
MRMTAAIATAFSRLCIVLVPALVLTGCGNDMSDLITYIDEVKARPGGRIEPLPQIKPYETFQYSAEILRSPFMPERPQVAARPTGPRPLANRNKEYLEQFPLDTLAMVGTVTLGGKSYGLVQAQDGLVHRILPGQYLGQNEGRVVSVGSAEIRVEELVSDGIGGFFKRSAAISLD